MSWGFFYALGALLSGLHFACVMSPADPRVRCRDEATRRRGYLCALTIAMALWPAFYVWTLGVAVVVAIGGRR